MLVPAGIYAAINWHDPVGIRGWAIPSATDIAFALGVLSLFGTRVPLGLKIFLMTLAVLDDLGAILIIALFYTSDLSVPALLGAGLALAALIALNRLGVMRIAPYVLVGSVLWLCVLKSGVHATLAGVVTALCIPARDAARPRHPPLKELEHALHPWVAFGILPIFAFAECRREPRRVSACETCCSRSRSASRSGSSSASSSGVFGFSWLAVKLGIARLPSGVEFRHVYGAADPLRHRLHDEPVHRDAGVRERRDGRGDRSPTASESWRVR